MLATGSKPAPRPARPAEAGYTLLELLVVLVVLALLSGIAVAAFPGRADVVELEGAARQVAALVGDARLAATAGGQVVAFDLDGTGRLRLTSGDVPAELPSGVVVELPSEAVRFFPDGSSSGGRLILRSGEHVRAVEIAWLDGSPHIVQALP